MLQCTQYPPGESVTCPYSILRMNLILNFACMHNITCTTPMRFLGIFGTVHHALFDKKALVPMETNPIRKPAKTQVFLVGPEICANRLIFLF